MNLTNKFKRMLEIGMQFPYTLYVYVFPKLWNTLKSNFK
jgi:hypothetical protein